MPNISLVPYAPPAPGLPANLSPPGNGQPPLTSVPQMTRDALGSLLTMYLTGSSEMVQHPSGDQLTVSFPTEHFAEDMGKALVVHEYPNQNSGRVENMWNRPKTWTITGIFTNNIDPDPSSGEFWVRGTLFPDIFMQVLSILESPGYKIMNHPLYGEVPVQVISRSWELVAKGPRDGARLTIKLMETIVDTFVSPNKPSVDSITAGTSCDLAFQTVGPDFPPPPGLSLSQIFGEIGSVMQSVASYPTDVVQAVADQTLVVSSFANALNPNAYALNASISFTYGSQGSQIQFNKSAPLGSPAAPFPNYSGGTNIVATSTASVQPAFFYGQEAATATRSLLALNTQSSKNVSTFYDKCLRATYDTMQYYLAMNVNQVSNIIVALQQMMLTIQTMQQNLAKSSTLNNVTINSITIPTNMSWLQLSKLVNNSLDNLFGLNNIVNPNYLFLPAGTQISYYQGI